VKDQTFTKQVVYLTGIRYENCHFIECTLTYDGGPGEMSACYYSPNTIWTFRGPAAMMLQTIERCGFHLVRGDGSGEQPIRFPSDADAV
jgi:hypothetical protein